MLPVQYIVVLVILLAAIASAITLRYKNTPLAAALIIVCLIYIFIGWINDFHKRTKNDPEHELQTNRQCIIGSKKQPNGLAGGGCLDIWHVYHFLFWMLLGLLAPNRLGTVVFLSIAWETVEHVAFKTAALIGDHTCNAFVCGRIEDVFINVAGYMIGTVIVANYRPNK